MFNRIGKGKVGLFTILFSTQLFASGYRLEFQSPSTFADGGNAAVVEDVGTNWYNAAGLVYLPQQLAVGATYIYKPQIFSGSTFAPSLSGSNFAASGKASSYLNTVPVDMHYGLPFGDIWAFGISIVPTFYLIADYGDHSMLRYDLTSIHSKSFDISPSLAIRINQMWSLGLGPDFNYLLIQNYNNVRTEGPIAFRGTPGDSTTRFSADHWGYGGHIGVLFSPNNMTRIGLNYRSQIAMNMQGFSNFVINGGPVFNADNFMFKFTLPPITTLSVYHDITPCWALMGTIAYDEWRILQAYHLENIVIPPGVKIPVIVKQHMHNTIEATIGTHYIINDQWMLRGSLGYRPTPTNTQFRDVSFPDDDKIGLIVGARYTITKKLMLDLIGGHVFIKKAPIHLTNPNTFVSVHGNVKSFVDLLGMQLVWNV